MLILFYRRTKWGWSDGKPLRDGSKFYEIIGKNADYIQDVLSQVVAPYKYCFLVTDIEQLTVKNCSEKHAYMCEGFQAELSTRLAESTQIRPTPLISEVTSTVTGLTESKSMPTQIRPTSMTTPFTSEVTATVSDDVADASTIMASKTLSTSTQMSTSISPTQPASAEKQIKTYLVKMKKLSVEDEDSLQIAVNETSLLLTRFRDGSHHKTTANVLIAAEQLEKFSLRYAKKHLMTNGTSTSTTTNIGKHFVMEIQNVKVGYKKEVTFPSEDDRELLAADRKEKIIYQQNSFGNRKL
ncbi:hypothetical protein OS493_033239 [Desmophyllum pertusum]|uniref:Uncharacterized protein n=1 Tax=Desmophyllum pertusum TaxID=174260 RepID=A0A9W9ZY49_9CNID|nr:hypothetical protein OS493_033239 [Desmophyllum pertusum]